MAFYPKRFDNSRQEINAQKHYDEILSHLNTTIWKSMAKENIVIRIVKIYQHTSIAMTMRSLT